MSLQLLDLFETTLSASYTAGGTSLTLTSVAGLPASGDYWLAVYDTSNSAATYEVFKATSGASGSVVTVVGAQANTTNKNHASGQTVYGGVLCGPALTQLKADAISGVSGGSVISSSLYASPPGSPASGAYDLITDAPYTRRYNGSSWDYYLPMAGKVDLVPTAGWTWDNQSTSTITFSTGQASLVVPPSDAAGIIRGQYRTAPATPYTLTIWMIPHGGAYNFMGIGFRDSSGKIQLWSGSGLGSISGVWNTRLSRFASAGSFSSDDFLGGGGWKAGMLGYSMTDNGTNLIFKSGSQPDQSLWDTGATVSRTSLFASGPTQIGLFAGANGTNPGIVRLNVLSWTLT